MFTYSEDALIGKICLSYMCPNITEIWHTPFVATLVVCTVCDYMGIVYLYVFTTEFISDSKDVLIGKICFSFMCSNIS